MIFYFSGTGNSQYVATQIAKRTNDKVISIAKEVKNNNYSFSLEKNENVVFVCPIYAWRLPKLVVSFIQQLKLENYNNNYISIIVTIGGSCGNAVTDARKIFSAKGYNVSSALSITMPDAYTVMFELTSDDLIVTLIEACNKTIESYITALDKKETFDKVTKGRFPSLMSRLVYPFFSKLYMSTKPFCVNSNCNSCGKCANVCPVDCIKLENGKPTWGKDCQMCLACLHHCPQFAINYGKNTVKRGRYIFPKRRTN